MKELWTKDRVTFKGKFWGMEGVSISPRPAQKPHVPVWFGSRALPALRRSVKSGDGWMGSGANVDGGNSGTRPHITGIHEG